MRSILRPVPLVFAAALIAGCSGPSEPETRSASYSSRTADSLSVPGMRSKDWAVADSVYHYPSMRVTKAQLDSARTFFAYCFRDEPGVPLTSTSLEVPWSQLTAHLPAPVAGHDRAVLFHYGLNAPAIQLAWSYRTVARDTNADGLHNLDYTDLQAYAWVGGASAVATEDDWVWDHQQKPDGRTYFNAVQINRLQQGDLKDHWDDVRSYDANACLLLWEKELKRMYDDNAGQFAGKEADVYLVVDCTAEWREDSGHTGPYIAHTLTTHLRLKEKDKPAVDLISNDPELPTRPYYNRGADYGNLCPVRCRAVVVR